MPGTPPLEPRAVTDAMLDQAVGRRRRRDLGAWLDRPTWIENSGTGGSSQLVCLKKSKVVPVLTPNFPIGSGIYGYGAPAWAALGDAHLGVLRRDELAVAVLERASDTLHTISLSDGVAAGYLRALNSSEFVVLVDEGPDRGRSIRRVALDGRVEILQRTTDLVSDLVVSDDGSRLAWVQWSSMTMPWDDARVVTARYEDDCLVDVTALESPGAFGQPTFIDDVLYGAYELGEWFVPVRHENARWITARAPDGEFRPDWCFGRRWIVPTSTGTLWGYVYRSETRFVLWNDDGTIDDVEPGPRYLYEMCRAGGRVYAIGSSHSEGTALWRYRQQKRSWKLLDHDEISTFDSSHPQLRSTTFEIPYVWRTPSPSPDDSNTLPGLVVTLHGGPTAYASLEFDWISELLCRSGMAVADVDYRGSSSYGRTYRRSLDGHWGDYDVHDVVAVIEELVASGEVDPGRVFVRGSSAGAMTALLASRHRLVKGVVSLNGVIDVHQLIESSGEFERQYLFRLIGATDIYAELLKERSPISHVEDICHRVLVIQGANDDIVPVQQARQFVERLRELDRDVRYLEFDNEGHSLSSPVNSRAALAAELDFYRIASQ